MRALALAAAAALVLSGCALRPRYAEFIGKETTAAVKLQLVEKKSGSGVADASIELGERNKLVLKTDAQGYFTLPIEKRFLDDNTLLVVNAPAGVGRTEVIVAPVAPPPTPEQPAADPNTAVY